MQGLLVTWAKQVGGISYLRIVYNSVAMSWCVGTAEFFLQCAEREILEASNRNLSDAILNRIDQLFEMAIRVDSTDSSKFVHYRFKDDCYN